MPPTTSSNTGPLALVNPATGKPVIQTPTPLTRLNYFDGKFLLRRPPEGRARLPPPTRRARTRRAARAWSTATT